MPCSAIQEDWTKGARNKRKQSNISTIYLLLLTDCSLACLVPIKIFIKVNHFWTIFQGSLFMIPSFWIDTDTCCILMCCSAYLRSCWINPGVFYQIWMQLIGYVWIPGQRRSLSYLYQFLLCLLVLILLFLGMLWNMWWLLTRFSLGKIMCLSSIVWLCASCGHYYGWLTWWKIPARFVFTYYWVSYCQLWKNIMFCTRRMSFHFSYDLGVLKYSHGCIWKDKYPVMSYPMDICMYVDLWLYIWCTSWLGMTIWCFFQVWLFLAI